MNAKPQVLKSETPDPAIFTPRERQTMALVAEGCTNALIALKLDISPRTAKFHVDNLLKKLNADSRASIAAMAVRLGFA